MSQNLRIHTATSQHDADACVEFLARNGIMATIDNAYGGATNSLGLTQTPEVYVSVHASEADRASELLRSALAMVEANTVEIAVEIGQLKGPVKVTCERCGKTTSFPGTMDGTTQECPQCFAFLDVGTLPEWDDWNVIDVEEDPTESSEEG